MKLPAMRKSSYLMISLAVVALDQWSKWQIEAHFEKYVPEPVIPGFLDLTHVTNSGVAFGMFASDGNAAVTVLLTLLGLGAMTVVGYYFWRTPSTDRTLLTSLALILGGAVGNLIDRVLNGAVTDFIDVYFGTYHWHTFNVADSAISVGIVLMVLDVFFGRRRLRSAPDTEGA